MPEGLALAFPRSDLPLHLSPFLAIAASVRDAGGAVRVPHAFGFAGIYCAGAAVLWAAAVGWFGRTAAARPRLFAGKRGHAA